MTVNLINGDMLAELPKLGERKVDATCQHCGRLFQVIPSRAKHGRGKSCSPACQYAADIRRRIAHVSGGDTPLFGCEPAPPRSPDARFTESSRTNNRPGRTEAVNG